MSWGYWGIVSGLLVLLTMFFFCIDLLYDVPVDEQKSDSSSGNDVEPAEVNPWHAA